MILLFYRKIHLTLLDLSKILKLWPISSFAIFDRAQHRSKISHVDIEWQYFSGDDPTSDLDNIRCVILRRAAQFERLVRVQYADMRALSLLSTSKNYGKFRLVMRRGACWTNLVLDHHHRSPNLTEAAKEREMAVIHLRGFSFTEYEYLSFSPTNFEIDSHDAWVALLLNSFIYIFQIGYVSLLNFLK